jgi:hypothetical protein
MQQPVRVLEKALDQRFPGPASIVISNARA